MVDITPPSAGDINWDVPLNAALVGLESAVTAVETGKVSKAGDTLTGSLNFSEALQINIGSSGSGAPLAVRRTNNTDATLSTRVGAEAATRFFIEAVGTHQWGDGTNSADTNLYRGAANRLQTDDTFRIGSAALLEFGAAGDVNLYATGGNLQTDDYFVMPTGQASGKFNIFSGASDALDFGTAGGGVRIKEGSNARMGTATLVAGTVTVNNTSVTANTRIFLTAQTSGAAPGALRVSARVAATSFTITSTSGTDTSSVAWLLVEPS